jgi:hypothetical protein
VLDFTPRRRVHELEAWDAYRQRREGKTYPKDGKGGWTFPTQWPPADEDADASYQSRNGLTHANTDRDRGNDAQQKGPEAQIRAPDDLRDG